MQKIACATLLAALLPGCASVTNDRLRAEIATLRGEVGTLEGEIVANTQEAGSRTEDLHTRVAYRPVQAWSERFNNRPPDQRTITFRQTARHGQIAKDDWGCGPFGDGGWYVEFNSSDATKANVLIELLQLTATTGQINASTPLSFDLRSQLHWHFDPCIGGGVGGSVGLSANKRFNTALRMSFQPVQDNNLRYALDLTSPNSIPITVVVHLGKIGDLGIPFELKEVARRISEGKINLAFANSGKLGPLPGGQTYTYTIRTANPALTTSSSAIELNSDVNVTVTEP